MSCVSWCLVNPLTITLQSQTISVCHQANCAAQTEPLCKTEGPVCMSSNCKLVLRSNWFDYECTQ